MKHEIKETQQFGTLLVLEHQGVEMGIALEYGLRIATFNMVGMENIFYEQPHDLSDNHATPEGWRLRGGHRLWTSPETDLSYYPDNCPITAMVEDNCVTITQDNDPWLHQRKSMTILFTDDGISVTHTVENVGDEPMTIAPWGVSTMKPGVISVPWEGPAPGDFTPRRRVNLWATTSLHDERLHFDHDSFIAEFMPLPDYCKVGLYAPAGVAVYEGLGQKFTLLFAAPPAEELPDGGCNFETYLGKTMMELESLGKVKTLQKGESASHTELWILEKV